MPSTACVPNIGPRERRQRLIVGLTMLALGAAAAVWLIASGAPRLWRAVLFVPLLIGLLGLFQVRAKTCVALAARGLRNMDTGPEPIADPATLRQVQAQASRVNLQAMTVAAVLTAALAAWPGAP